MSEINENANVLNKMEEKASDAIDSTMKMVGSRLETPEGRLDKKIKDAEKAKDE